MSWGRKWYLVAWDTEREDWRTFRVDRMRPRTPTGPRFTPRPLPGDGDLASYVARGVSSAGFRVQADSAATVAVYLGLLDLDFDVTEPPELVSRLRLLAERYHRACPTTGGEAAPRVASSSA